MVHPTWYSLTPLRLLAPAPTPRTLLKARSAILSIADKKEFRCFPAEINQVSEKSKS